MRVQKYLIGIIAVAVLLRVCVALLMGDQVQDFPGIFDQISYDRLAQNVVAGNGFSFDVDWWPVTRACEPTAHWSYLMTIYLVAVYKLFGHHPLIARLIQAVLAGALMPFLVYRISTKTFRHINFPTFQRSNGPTVSLVAAAWVACYPYYVYYGAALMTETFYITGILWTLDCALRIAEQSPIRNSKFAIRNFSFQILLFLELGLAIGLTTLLRQAFLPFVPVLFVWLWWAQGRSKDSRSALRQVLVGGLVSIIVIGALIAPFTLLNYKHFKRFVLLNTNAGYAFFWANHPIQGTKFISLFTPDMPSYQELIPQELRYLDEAALDQELMKLGLQFILDDPARFAQLTLSRIPAHFIFWPLPKSSLPSNLTRVFSFGLALPFMLLGGIRWFIDVRRGYLKVESGFLLVLYICVHTCVYLVSWAGIRYRLPTDAVGLVFAAYALVWLLEKLPCPYSRYLVYIIGKNG